MIEIEHVTKTFKVKEGDLAATNDVSLTIGDGEIFGIIGYSGAGKSTLVRCLNLLEKPDAGIVRVKGFGAIESKNGRQYYTPEGSSKASALKESDLQKLRSNMGMIFQHFNLMDRSTVFENVAYPLRHTGKSRQQIKRRVLELLEMVDLTDKVNAYPSELSGGQKQRVGIARALANDPQILLSDEATSALDPDATESILTLLKGLNRKLGLTIVLITHEMDVVKEICDKVAVMENGRVVEQGNVYDVFSHPVMPITKKFVDSSSDLADISKILEEHPELVSAPGVLVRCMFGKDCVGEAITSEVVRRYDVNMNIILADVEILQGSPLGGLIVHITGESQRIDEALAYLKECRVETEVLKDGRLA